MSTPENATPAVVVDPAATKAGMDKVEQAVKAAEARKPAKRVARPKAAAKPVAKAAAKPVVRSKPATVRPSRPAPAKPVAASAPNPATVPVATTPKTVRPSLKETIVSTDFKAQADRLAAETIEQTEKLRERSVEFGRQFAELSLTTTERAVKQGTDLYLGAVEQLPVPFFKELAKAQVELTLLVSHTVVKQSRELLAASK
jgi:hypothetical protein